MKHKVLGVIILAITFTCLWNSNADRRDYSGHVPMSSVSTVPTKESRHVRAMEAEPRREFKEVSRAVDKLPRREKSRVLRMTATAYTWTGHRTASGTWPKEGRTIAVDPRVIPLGSVVIINGNKYIAEDIIPPESVKKGAQIDIYMSNEQEAIKWGRRTVEILEGRD